MKRVIITGATGAVGTALIRRCIKSGTEVLVFAREGSKRNENIPKSPCVKIKYCPLDALAEVQNDTGLTYDAFYHFAWEGTFGSTRNDTSLQCRNIKYALDAASAAKRFGCSVFIGAGSQAEYGRVEGVLKADTPAFPENGYGIAKLSAGRLTRILCEQLEIKHIWVRILSVYGPFDGAATMVMSTVNKLKNGEIPVFTKGEQMWDYLYSDDAADAFYLLGEKGVSGKTYVLGGGRVRPLKEYIYDIRDTVSPNAEISLGGVPYAQNQVMYLCADISELQNDTGWSPKTDFCDGIKITAK